MLVMVTLILPGVEVGISVLSLDFGDMESVGVELSYSKKFGAKRGFLLLLLLLVSPLCSR